MKSTPDIYTPDYFEQRCGGYEFFNAYGHKILKPLIQAAVKEAKIKPHHKVLDVGCGRGELVANLTDKGVDAKGIDFSESAINLAKKTFPKAQFSVSSAAQLPFAENSFDRIFFLGIIEHLTNSEIEKSLEQMAAMLKPGGKILITTCTNQLYFKVLTYRWKLAGVSALRKLGIQLKTPSPLKSEEDDAMHINEVHRFSLGKALKSLSWPKKIIPRPNPKLATIELYGKNVPADFPVRYAPKWKQWFYQTFCFWFPLNLFLARAYLAVIEKPRSSSYNEQ